MTTRRNALGLLVIALFVSAAGPAPQPTLTLAPLLLFDGAVPHDTLIQPGDLVEVNVFELISVEADYDAAHRVAPDGNIHLPQLGAVRVENLTAREARDAIESALSLRLSMQAAQALRVQAKGLMFDAGPLKPGDTFDLKIDELEKSFQNFEAILTIDPQGRVQLPVLGSVHVAGLDLHQIETLLRDRVQREGPVHQARLLDGVSHIANVHAQRTGDRDFVLFHPQPR